MSNPKYISFIVRGSSNALIAVHYAAFMGHAAAMHLQLLVADTSGSWLLKITQMTNVNDEAPAKKRTKRPAHRASSNEAEDAASEPAAKKTARRVEQLPRQPVHPVERELQLMVAESRRRIQNENRSSCS